MTRAIATAAALALACAACDGPHGQGAAEATVEASAAPSIDAAAAARAGATAQAVAAWRGSYTSAAGALYIPADWKDVHWKVKESDTGIGAGAITMRVDPASGRVVGSLEGPLGPAVFDGLVADGKLTAKIARADPSDEGFMGTMLGSLANGRAEGTMNVSLALAGAIRTATFTMALEGAKAAPP